jgi:hypothetical protein
MSGGVASHALARRWRRRAPRQRLLLLATPSFAAGIAVLLVAVTGHRATGTGHVAIQCALLATPTGFCAITVVRTANAALWASLLSALAAVVLGTAVEIAAAYAGLVLALVGYILLTAPENLAVAVNGIVLLRSAEGGFQRLWRGRAGGHAVGTLCRVRVLNTGVHDWSRRAPGDLTVRVVTGQSCARFRTAAR